MPNKESPVSLSRDLLDLLRMLGDPTLLDYLRMLWANSPIEESEEDRLATERGQTLMRALATRLVESRLEPTLRASYVPFGECDLPSHVLRDVVPDEQLDEHFTRTALSTVPEVVYLREATTCYLYGLPGAAAVRCHAGLESALAEVLARLDVIMQEGLEQRIAQARDTGILTRDMARKAHEIKDVGNEAIHNVSCSEPRARDQIRRTAEVLQHVYSAART